MSGLSNDDLQVQYLCPYRLYVCTDINCVGAKLPNRGCVRDGHYGRIVMRCMFVDMTPLEINVRAAAAAACMPALYSSHAAQTRPNMQSWSLVFPAFWYRTTATWQARTHFSLTSFELPGELWSSCSSSSSSNILLIVWHTANKYNIVYTQLNSTQQTT